MLLTSSIKEPLRTLPENWENQSIVIKLSGGLGDVVMSLGGTARALKRKFNCEVTVACMEYQTPLLLSMEGVDSAIPVTSLNSPEVRGKFNILLDFSGIFASSKQLISGDYYEAISKRANLIVEPGRFYFNSSDKKIDNKEVICLHPGASNPNRRWLFENWRELAYELAYRNFHVRWLGTRGDYGFSDQGIEKLSDDTDDLVFQAKQLASAHYFIGNDSGFAHVAGILNKKGLVLFGATAPEDVISHYPLLDNISAFEWLKVKPTRSLNINDETSLRALQAISVQDVLKKAGFYATSCNKFKPKFTQKRQIKVAIISSLDIADKLAAYLSSCFEVNLFPNLIEDKCSQYEAVITIDRDGNKEKITLETRQGRCRLSIDNYASVERAIRERI